MTTKRFTVHTFALLLTGCGGADFTGNTPPDDSSVVPDAKPPEATGGAVGSGGATSGGSSATGGSGGGLASGGAIGSTGGVEATGGAAATGGAVGSTGGVQATGGAVGTGGAPAEPTCNDLQPAGTHAYIPCCGSTSPVDNHIHDWKLCDLSCAQNIGTCCLGGRQDVGPCGCLYWTSPSAVSCRAE